MNKSIILAVAVLSVANAMIGNPDQTAEDRKQELLRSFGVTEDGALEDIDLPANAFVTHVLRNQKMIFSFNLHDMNSTEARIVINTPQQFDIRMQGIILTRSEMSKIISCCASSREMMFSIIKCNNEMRHSLSTCEYREFFERTLGRDAVEDKPCPFMFSELLLTPISIEQITETLAKCMVYAIRRSASLQHAPMPHREVKITVLGLAGPMCDLDLNSESTVAECVREIAEKLDRPQENLVLSLNNKVIDNPAIQIRDLLSDENQRALSMTLVIAEDPDPLVGLSAYPAISVVGTLETRPIKLSLKNPESEQNIAGFTIHMMNNLGPKSKIAILSILKEALVVIQKGDESTHGDKPLSSRCHIVRGMNSLILSCDFIHTDALIEFHMTPDSSRFEDYITHVVFPDITRVYEHSWAQQRITP